MSISREALETYFRRRAGERIEEMGRLRDRLLGTDVADAERAEAEARLASHQLAGTAASFGFPSIGDLARTAELASRDQLAPSLAILIAALREVRNADEPDPDEC